MYEHKKSGEVQMENGHPKAKTSHSLNKVPCIIYDPTYNGEYKKELNEDLGISSIAATVINFLGFEARITSYNVCYTKLLRSCRK